MNKPRLLLIIVLLFISAIRLFKLDHFPPSPYWEEVALGYDAYSILKTGKDHHGNLLPIVAFESFGDWKPSLYFYAIVPFIALFDLNTFAIRLPAALSGILTILGIAYIAQHFYKKNEVNKKNSIYIFIFSLFIAGISPWGIIFSRAAWEAMLATALITWGTFFAIKSIDEKYRSTIHFLLSVVLFCLSIYTYHSAKIVAPALIAVFFSLHLFHLKKNAAFISIKNIVVIAFFSFILLFPIIKNVFNPVLSQRFAETSIFTDLSIIEESNNLKEISGNSFASKILYHRYILFSREILYNFFSHFTFDYLFISGDENVRHSIQFMGILYPIEAISLLLGTVYMIKKRNIYSLVLLVWLVFSILPASITHASPHALRTLLAFPIFMLFSTFGWYYAYNLLEEKLLKSAKTGIFFKNLLIGSLVFLYLAQLSIFGIFYIKIYPSLYSSSWQFGYKEMYSAVHELELLKDYKKIYITREQNRPAMYYWFYSKQDPKNVQNNELTAKKDQQEFITYNSFIFTNVIADINEKPSIVVLEPKQYTELNQEQSANFKLYKTIKNIRNEDIFLVGTYE